MGPTPHALSEMIAGRADGDGRSGHLEVPRLVRAIRAHLGMDVAFVSEFKHGRRYFRHVDARHPGSVISQGTSHPLEETLCQRVADGRLPELVADARQAPAALEVLAAAQLPVGAHLSVPIRLGDGTIYGTFCCFSFTADPTLNSRDLAMMRVFAELAADEIDRDLDRSRVRADAEGRINTVLVNDAVSMVFQPIVHVAQERVVGYEALARFSMEPARSPDAWFNEAAEVGKGLALEIKVIQKALPAVRSLPADAYLSLNTSPETLVYGDLKTLFRGWPLDRLVLEVTEHAIIDHYGEIASIIDPLRRLGLRVAVDDAGAGYANFRHILSLAPDIIKLDMSITRDIHQDRARRALAAALIGFANATGSKIVAEGVESAQEMAVLRELGVNKVQGYFVGRPMTLAAAAVFGLSMSGAGPA